MPLRRVTIVCTAFLMWPLTAAVARNDGKADPSLLLGELQTYSSRETAQRACRNGPVVWADRFSGFYYDSGEPKYGATDAGSYTCLSDAKRSGYWSTDPRAGMEGHPGRSFPFDRLFFGS